MAPNTEPLLTQECSGVAKGISEGQGTFTSAVLTLSISCVGTGVLAFPYAFKSCGVLAALLTCATMALVLGFTLYACVYCCECASRHLGRKVESYHHLVRTVGGERLAYFTEVVIWLYSFGISLGCLVIIGDISEPLVARLASKYFTSTLQMRAAPIIVITLTAVLPLSLLRNITSLSYSSFFGVVGVFYLVGLIICKYATHAEPAPEKAATLGLTSLTGIFTSIPLMCFALGSVPRLALPTEP
ncbi:hypothetical protein CYMTET_46542 [Cymbomonas tetramitiformis]|uniref:Amino acid transporter transmembrane domain-containing protein n=1 Tax=Cymbomonas tetramitiformis TaxID=36881 RepID=A0AAE0BVX8_9CHLO|nr:hypothetical protein CYMTET_46542 [Cymbomonas tetramitiformis]